MSIKALEDRIATLEHRFKTIVIVGLIYTGVIILMFAVVLGFIRSLLKLL